MEAGYLGKAEAQENPILCQLWDQVQAPRAAGFVCTWLRPQEAANAGPAMFLPLGFSKSGFKGKLLFFAS